MWKAKTDEERERELVDRERQTENRNRSRIEIEREKLRHRPICSVFFDSNRFVHFRKRKTCLINPF